ncbi:membrane-bound lytic murein transglycosylase MltF [Aliivibrio kagoshimensis]|uniref:membrane-bound lytic murein transglycosylase MltF n=1 Tax=Aliivibrio kagoshimensis TaxID=2910230 RepID=UPI003D0EC680
MRNQLKIKYKSLFLITLFSIVLTGCQIDSEPKSKLDEIRERGVLRVGTLNNQLSYYIGTEGPTGLDYDLAKLFAEQLNVKLEMKPAYSFSGLFPALERDEVDIIAANLTVTPNRLKRFRSGPVYYYVSQQLVYKKGEWRPRNIKNLIEQENHLTIPKHSSFESTLFSLKSDNPDLEWQTNANLGVTELLKLVAEGKLDYTIADSVQVALSQRIHPEIAVAFELTEDQPIAWYLNKSNNESLLGIMIEFFGDLKQSGELVKLEEKYFGHVETFDYVDTRAFIRAIDSKLDRWEPLFKKYAGEFDWRLLAALSYQESHWRPNATSPTGVRGMMMLTKPTAASVGVRNRLDPEQSIQGGSKYLSKIVRRVPDSIESHEKIWFALASYNVGFGHMMDARRLTQRQGADPDSWGDVKERLPLLRQKKYYSKSRYGFARGDEAKKYVENIRRYYQSIVGYELEKYNDELEKVDINVDNLTTINVTIDDIETPEKAVSAAADISSDE